MHRNARLTHWDRQELVRRIESGTPIAHVAVEMNVSRPTAGKWWGRSLADPDGQWWVDRSSRPRHCPHQTRRKVERRIVSLRRNRKLGPARIAGQVKMSASRVHRVLVRHGVNRLRWMDRACGPVDLDCGDVNPGDPHAGFGEQLRRGDAGTATDVERKWTTEGQLDVPAGA